MAHSTPSVTPHAGDRNKNSNLALVPQWVAQQFYRHGLFCSSQVGAKHCLLWRNYMTSFQPLAVLVFAFIGILWACYPLLTIQVYSGDAKIWIHGDVEDIGPLGQWSSSSSPFVSVFSVPLLSSHLPYTHRQMTAWRHPRHDVRNHVMNLVSCSDGGWWQWPRAQTPLVTQTSGAKLVWAWRLYTRTASPVHTPQYTV